MAPDLTYGKLRNLEGGNPTDYGMRKNYVVRSCGKHPREDSLALGVRPMVGKIFIQNLEKILSWLNESNKINKIGVFGMGGCGKTTLAIHVYNGLLESELSRDLVWVTMGVGFDVYQLQRCIASAVNLDLEYEKDETKRAARLHNFLTKRGNYVLILDNVWDHFSFGKVGIPSSGACKVIINTRMLSACRRIGCQKTLKIGMLETCEAWQLFCSVVGQYGHDSSSLATDGTGNIAQRVCQECAGLPLAIVHLARNLRGVHDVSEWKLTLHRLRGFSEEDDFLITKYLFSKLYSSYTRLNNAHIKLSFLCCALYSKSCKIQKEELIRLWIAVGIIEEVPSLQAQYDKGHTIVNFLVDSNLLESLEDGHYVKMHNMIRNMAIQITRKETGLTLLIRCEEPLKDVEEVLEVKEDYFAISIVKNCITEVNLGTSPKCPKLSVVLLQHNPSRGVTASFLSHMPSVHVLDLSRTSIQRVPDSISNLNNLKSLLLHCCQKLTYVPSLANLVALRMLDLGYTAIGGIPSGIEKLTMLRELDLSGFYKMKGLNQRLFDKLPSLKRLSCYAAGIVQELQTLRSLEILDATFHNISDYKKYVESEHWRKLDGFQLHVRFSEEQEQPANKVLAHYSNVVSFNGCSFAGEREQLSLPDNLNKLYIDNCEGFGSLCDLLNWDDKTDLKDNLISKNEQNLNSQGHKGKCEKSCWEKSSLPSSKQLFEEDISGPLLSSLELCSISRCCDIEKIFTPVMIMGLQNLEILEIRECFKLRELIVEKDSDQSPFQHSISTMGLPNLRKMKLTRLPVLSSIYSGQLVCTSLKSLLVDDCPKLTQLPFSFFLDDQHKLPLPMLEQIEGQDEWWDSLELYQHDAKLSLQTLFRQKISTESTHSASEYGSCHNPIADLKSG